MAPNILLVVADDQPKGLVDAMPSVRSYVRDMGVEFVHAVSQTPLCSAARASLVTGNYSNKTGVWTNQPGNYGAWPALEDNEGDTIATRLSGKGYHTALVGKYINKFSRSPEGYVPPGWDDFITMETLGGEGAGSYYDYTLKGTIDDEIHGSDETDYSTDVLRDKAIEVIGNVPAGKPLFLMYTPWGPHGNYAAAPRHVGTWTQSNNLPGSFNEADMTDKPDWMQALPLADEEKESSALAKMHEAVMSIDEAVGALLSALGPRMHDCLVIYVSDNGKMLGSHRAVKKGMPHKWATEVPCFMRWVGRFTPGEKSVRPVPNVDITATIAEAAGVTGWNIDGRSVLSLNRIGTAMMGTDNPEQNHPAYCGYRNKRYLYVEYTADQPNNRELYDYETDPNELNNLAYLPEHADLVADLRGKAIAQCDPVPPNFTWSGGGTTKKTAAKKPSRQ